MIGIDPGLEGAIAYIQGTELSIWDMPVTDASGERQVDAIGLSELFCENGLADDYCYVELVHSAPKQGVASTFKFGRGFGVALGVAAAFKNTLELIRPSIWKPKLRVSAGKSKAEKNANAIARASHFFPKATGAWKRKKDADRAEAALIALYGSAARGIAPLISSCYVNGQLV